MVEKHMKYKQWLASIFLIFIYISYVYIISINNNFLGDILSPIIMLIITGAVFYGYVFRQKSTMQKCYGVLLALSLFSWFVCDFLWGIQTQILHINPDKCVITEYGYSLTNIFLFLAIALAAYHDLKKMNKIQALLDALVVSIYAIVLL